MVPCCFSLIWACAGGVSSIVRAAPPVSGREVDALRRLESEADSDAARARSSDSLLEPGVFGIRPAGPPVAAQHHRAAHRRADRSCTRARLCHVRRRDNLAAPFHMVVQTVFWFHPLVWWIGARLIDERERACDEEVIRRGSEPEVYAESILKTCRVLRRVAARLRSRRHRLRFQEAHRGNHAATMGRARLAR